MKEFFAKEENKGTGYVGGSNKNMKDIAKYVRPFLNSIDFDCRNAKEDNSSNKQLIYHKSEPKKTILAQIIIIDSIHNVDSRANSNISEDMVNTITEDERIQAHWNLLRENKVYLFLYSKQGSWYIFVPYADIPVEHYYLTYRGRPDRKNRMYISAEHLPKFRKLHYLEQNLKSILNIT